MGGYTFWEIYSFTTKPGSLINLHCIKPTRPEPWCLLFNIYDLNAIQTILAIINVYKVQFCIQIGHIIFQKNLADLSWKRNISFTYQSC